MLEQTQGIHLHAKFDLNVFIVSASGGQKPHFWAILTFGGLLYQPPLPMRVKFGVLEQTEGMHLHCKFYMHVFIVSASGGQKPQFWTNIDLFWRGAPVPTPFYR